MPALFSLGQRAALRIMQQHLLPNESLLAFLDDVYVVVPPNRVRPVYDTLAHTLQSQASIQLNQGKTRAWNASGIEPPSIRDFGEDVWVGNPNLQDVRVSIFVGQAGLKPWSHTCLEQHWKLAHYAVNLPCDRWLPRLLHWKLVGQRRVGRPRQQWDDMLRTFCRYKRLGEWELAARDGRNWETLMPDFIHFCSGS